MGFCIPFIHKWTRVPAPGSGFLYDRCGRCGKVRAKVAPPLALVVEPRLDQDPNPKRWIAGPGVSSGGEVGVRNPVLSRGYANDNEH